MNATILIVDDSDSNIKLIESLLLMEYYVVIKANNALEALEVLKEHKVDIILLDIMMPGMSGFEACKKIKQNPETTHIPIVIVTAITDGENMLKCLKAGADDFLSKPVNSLALFARIKSLARMKSVIDELKIRNKINEELGADIINITDDFSNSRIVIIDDDLVQGHGVRNYMSPVTRNTLIINSAKYLNQVESFAPDLIIISCQIFGEDPIRTTVMIRSNPKFQNIALMLLAEDDHMNIVMKAMGYGINDYLSSPVNEDELKARITTQLKKKQYQDNLRNELDENYDLSKKDGLTNVFNRRYFDIHMQQIFDEFNKKKSNVSLIIMDIDNFKEVNDLYGHNVGDLILKSVSQIIKTSLRVTDLIARYGGEEFVVLLSNSNIEGALQTAEKIRVNVEKSEVRTSNSITINRTVSIGVAQLRRNETILEFIDRADKCLYKAKKLGKNKIMS